VCVCGVWLGQRLLRMVCVYPWCVVGPEIAEHGVCACVCGVWTGQRMLSVVFL
jgi:hypothetical protein